MRRIVTDTNVVVSGLLWTGVPQQVLDAGRFGIVKLVTCQRLLDELGNTLTPFRNTPKPGGIRVHEEQGAPARATKLVWGA